MTPELAEKMVSMWKPLLDLLSLWPRVRKLQDGERYKLEAFGSFETCGRSCNQIYVNNYKGNVKRQHVLNSYRALDIILRTTAFKRQVYLALAGWLGWLVRHPHTPRLQGRSPIRAHTRSTNECINQWNHSWCFFLSLPKTILKNLS